MSGKSSAASQKERICLEVRRQISTVDPNVETRKTACSVTTLRLREIHLDGPRVGVGSAIGASDNRNVVDVLGKESVQVGAVVSELAVNHGGGAVEARFLRVGGADGDVERCRAPR